MAAGADPSAAAEDGTTPMHVAARGGHAGAVRALLRAMRPRDWWNVRDVFGQRPIDVASGDAREVLIEAG